MLNTDLVKSQNLNTESHSVFSILVSQSLSPPVMILVPVLLMGDGENSFLN